MYYIVYKITNLVNDKIYIGIHKTSNLDDGYMGSGVNIRRAIKKYGLDSFKKEYLSIFDNESEMYEMESKIVNDEFLNREESYNIKEGGFGGWDYVNSILTKEHRIKQGSGAGSWNDLEKRRKVYKSVPIEKRKEIGKKLGDKYGGINELKNEEIERRLELIKDINLLEYGWVKKVSERLELTHTQVKRFIEKHYRGEYHRRNKN
jgi:hypothetical protein